MNNLVTLIDHDMRKRIEKRRLERLILKKARPPTEGECARLMQMIRAIEPQANAPFIGMHAVTLDRSNLNTLDCNGIASLKADGLHAHAAFVNCEENNEALGERRDAAIFVLRGASGALPQRFAVDFIFQRTMTPVLLDGELCLRKRQLTPEEFRAVNSGQNVHTRPYLQYPSAADAQAHADGTDIASDEYQAVYDAHFELVYAAFDCMYLQSKAQISRSYAERIALVRDLFEASPVVEQTKRYRVSVDHIRAALAYAGGAENFALRMFMKPMFSMQHTSAAMHVVPACMQGIAIDGVIFNTSSDQYIVGTNPRLLKWKPENTADLVVVREQFSSGIVPDRFVLFAQADGMLVPVSDALLLDTPNARWLVDAYAMPAGASKPMVLECVGVRVQEPVLHVGWRPAQPRPEKSAPNSVATYQNVHAAAAQPLDEAAIVAALAALRAT